MLRMLKYLLPVLAVCLLPLPLAHGAAGKKDDSKPVVAVFTFDREIVEKPVGEEFPLFAPIAPASPPPLACWSGSASSYRFSAQ